MEHLSDLQGTILSEHFSVPLWEVIVFIVINSICLLFGRTKMGLLISYSFVFYWGFIFNVQHFVSVFDKTPWGMAVYILSGFVMFGVAITGFFVQGRD